MPYIRLVKDLELSTISLLKAFQNWSLNGVNTLNVEELNDENLTKKVTQNIKNWLNDNTIYQKLT